LSCIEPALEEAGNDDMGLAPWRMWRKNLTLLAFQMTNLDDSERLAKMI